jgi:ATP-binding cassette subfamily C protein CydC
LVTVLRMLRFLRPFWTTVLASVLLGVATIASGVGLLGTSAYLISRAALQPSIAVLQVSIVGVRFFWLSRGIFRYVERLVSHSANFKLLAQLRTWFFKSVEPLAPAGLTYLSSGDLLARSIADIDTLEDFFVRLVSPPLVALVTTLCASLFVDQFDPRFGLILMLGLLASSFGIPVLSSALQRKSRNRLVQSRSDLHTAITDNILGITDVLVYGDAEEVRRRIKRLRNTYQDNQRKLAWREALADAANLLFSNLTMWLILLVAIPLVSIGQLDGVLLAVLAMIALTSFEAAQPMGLVAQNLENSASAAQRLFEIADARPEIATEALASLNSTHPTIEIKQLSFGYDSTQPGILDQVSISLTPGKKIAIVGPSGSGKTTLLNLLLRFWNYREGIIEIDGVDLHEVDAGAVRDQFSVLSQNAFLMSGTIRQNLLLSMPEASEDSLMAAIDLAQMTDWLKTLPDGLDTWIGENGVQISGGEHQRLAIARLALRDRPIWILDEPSSHLDAITEQKIIERILDACKDRTLIWVTHRLTGLEKMDEILVLSSGHIVENGKHQQLLQQEGLYARMWHIQNREIFDDLGTFSLSSTS